jgi:YHS domain-containing protein
MSPRPLSRLCQQRKSSWPFYGVLATAFCCLALAGWPHRLDAATTELYVSDRNGIAFYGFDPVSFFIDGAPRQGVAAFELVHGGVVVRFRNEGNRAAFAQNPETYLPRYGGYDALAIGRGSPAPGLPQFFVIRSGQLYFFASEESRANFIANSEEVLAAAEFSWPRVRRGLVH